MASSLALRRLAGRNLLSGVLPRPLQSLSIAPSVTRSFNTSTQMVTTDDDDHEDRYDRAVSRRRDFPGFFPGSCLDVSLRISVSNLLNSFA